MFFAHLKRERKKNSPITTLGGTENTAQVVAEVSLADRRTQLASARTAIVSAAGACPVWSGGPGSCIVFELSAAHDEQDTNQTGVRRVCACVRFTREGRACGRCGPKRRAVGALVWGSSLVRVASSVRVLSGSNVPPMGPSLSLSLSKKRESVSTRVPRVRRESIDFSQLHLRIDLICANIVYSETPLCTAHCHDVSGIADGLPRDASAPREISKRICFSTIKKRGAPRNNNNTKKKGARAFLFV